jgi:2Fe-2S ferredoxin
MHPKLSLIFEGQPIPIHAKHTCVLDALLEAKVLIDHSCGGMGTCGTCRVNLDPKSIQPAPTEGELAFRGERPLRLEERLTCQLACSDQLIVSRG